jgi:hypothetical protein
MKHLQHPIEIFKKGYHGFEDIFDLNRDISEMWDVEMNPLVKDIPAEFRGSVLVRVMYVPYVSPKAKLLDLVESFSLSLSDREELKSFLNALDKEE